MDFRNFKPCLLIAMPELTDPNFAKSVVLLSDYEDKGAVGFVLNHETTLTLNEALNFSTGDLVEPYKTYPLHLGGPVDPQRIWILYQQNAYRKVLGVDLGDGVAMAEDGQLLIDHKIEMLPSEVKVFHGSAGWSAKQLQTEIVQSFWLTTKISKELIFETPIDEMWEKAIRKLGIDPTHLQGGVNSQILN